jgi:hypothetical protein
VYHTVDAFADLAAEKRRWHPRVASSTGCLTGRTGLALWAALDHPVGGQVRPRGARPET